MTAAMLATALTRPLPAAAAPVAGAASGRCLHAGGGVDTQGTALRIWDCNGRPNQKWRQNSDGSITGVQPGLCLDADGAGTAVGNAAQANIAAAGYR
ncbi:RICIN domain-containing protein [Streptomyces sp. IBSBF 2435]|uniref:RICIN domain-containing protein n=1 Tax=Streptomyces sp. IBSBF 2435 TaxID=2903531 RepID=UPI002FDBF5DF